MKAEIVLIGAVELLVVLIGIFYAYPELVPEKNVALEKEALVENFTLETEYSSGGSGERSLIEFTPSINEIRQVLKEDRIDEVTYSDDFNCVEFSFGLMRALKDKGIYSCVAWAVFEDGSHALVAVNSSYYGVIYIEPQTDKIIYDLKEGDNYCDVVGWNCEWEIQKIKSCFSEIDY
ncbi:MAG: hypothetical protein WC494_03910 [Candidatus Pacearchaeota archaeon]